MPPDILEFITKLAAAVSAVVMAINALRTLRAPNKKRRRSTKKR